MAKFCGEKSSEPKLNAAELWRKGCLLAGESVFSSDPVWTLENVTQLTRYFVENVDEGDGDFFEKLESQLEPAAPQVKQLAAEMLWFMLLCPSNVKPDTKRQAVARIWQWSGQPFNPADELWSDAALDGIGSSGTSFSINRPRELVYFIKLTAALLKLPSAERAELASTPWLLAEWLEQIPENDKRQLRHMLLYLLFPDTFERIFGGTDRKAVVAAFTGMKKREVGKLSAMQIDKQLSEIRAAQEVELQVTDIDFYVSPLRELWKDAGHKQWLFTWNPDNWDWEELADAVARTASGESVVCRWSCANSNVAIGDKAWLLRLGKPPKGIFAVGNVVSEPYEDDHWNTEKRAQGVKSRYVDIEFTRVLDVYKDQFVAEDDLANIKIDKQNWLPQSSGIEIQSRSAGLLEKLWAQLTTQTTGTVSALAKLKDPVNIIYFGPPGTGKTYELNSLLDRYTSTASAVSKEQWLAQELQPLRWFDVVVMALNDLGGSAKVAAIEEHIFVQQKAKAVGRTRHIRAQIWATLQTHTVEISETVNYSKRQAPYIFDKSTASVWHLTGDWQEACEDQLRQADALQAGPNDSKAQRRYEFVTFHQAYSYEEFVEGLRPVIDEDSGELVYKVVPGVFRRLCQLAQNDPAQRYAMFIDEINRGNITKILGELINLVEIDKRGEFNGDSVLLKGMSLTLPYSGDKFSVPKNLDIFGTMNTADRSIALLDTALRRRFIFKELMPKSDYISGAGGDGYIDDGEGGVIDLRALLDSMNKRIRFLLNRDVMLGHAYLSKVKEFESLKSVMLNQFVPLLQEYFYDDWYRIQLVLCDVGAGGKKIEPQIVRHRVISSKGVFGFEHDDFEDAVEYEVVSRKLLAPDAVRKIYEDPATN